MSRYFTKTLASLEPYTPGEQLKIADLVKLNANENPYPPAPGVAAAVAAAVPGLRLYSDLSNRALNEAIAAHWGVQPENILCGNGSDENLLLALRAFCDESTPLAFADVTYSFYTVLCDLLHIPQHIIPLEADLTIDLKKYCGLHETIVIANPNAPTSLLAPVAAIEEVLKTNPDNIVIVDETYVEFAPAGSSCLPLLEKYDNLVITHTFSKTHNLAGARLGFCIARPELIADMNRVKFSYSPYNVNSMTQAAGVAAISDEAYFADVTAKVIAERTHTTAELRRRGFTPASIRNFCDRIGVAKSASVVEYSFLEHCLREDLNEKAERTMGVLHPVKLVITNYPEGKSETVTVENNPTDPASGTHEITFSRECWIEADDFMEVPVPKYKRLTPNGPECRLKGAYLITCTGCKKDENGNVVEVYAEYDPNSPGGDPADGRKVKGATIHWVDAATALDAEVRVYSELFSDPAPDGADKDFLACMNPDSLEVLSGCKVEPRMRDIAAAYDKTEKKGKTAPSFQFMRLGYFCLDNKDCSEDHLVFNRSVTLKDSFKK